MPQPHLELVRDESPDLRAKLRDAIERRDALLAKAAIAQAAFDNAKHLLCDAAERLKAELDANQQAATQRHSRAILVALRTGSPPPVGKHQLQPTPPPRRRPWLTMMRRSWHIWSWPPKPVKLTTSRTPPPSPPIGSSKTSSTPKAASWPAR